MTAWGVTSMTNKIFVILIAVIASVTILIGLRSWDHIESRDHTPPGLCKDKPKSHPNQERC
jgi:hypothetical protein